MGINDIMKSNNHTPLVIMAINTDSYTNDIKAIQEYIPKYNRKALQGVYKGTSELAYLVEVNDNMDAIQAIASKHNQDCILYLDNQRNAYLVYPDNSQEHIGVFKSASKQLAEKQDSYTYNPETNTYYIVS